MARSTLHLIPIALLAAGCIPQSAVLTDGQYWAFLSDGTSFSLKKGDLDPADWSPDSNWNIDCREFNNRAERLARQLDPRLRGVCRPDNPPAQPLCKMSSTANRRPQPGVDVACEQWMDQSAWRVFHEKLDPWRGEAIITGENDFQVTFHHRIPGGEDFRFAFVVARDFQPTECVVNDQGEVVPAPIDGDWIGEWTKDLGKLAELEELPSGYEILADFLEDPKARLFYLNARGYQFNPGQRADHTFWSIPLEWRAGYAAGKYASELFHSRAPRWGQAELYDEFEVEGEPPENNPNDIWFCDMKEGDDPAENTCMQNRIRHAWEVADQVGRDLAFVGVSTELVNERRGLGEPVFQPLVHDNLWRAPDGFPPGFDGWVELHYSYVVISGDIEAGEPVKGAFSLVFDGDDSNSRFLVQGKFDVPKIKNDKWTAADLRTEKYEENGTKRCSGVSIGY